MSVPGAGFTIPWGGVSLSANTAKTVAGVAAGANKPITIVEICVDCDATSGNMLVELVYGTNVTNPPGTNSASAGALQVRGVPSTFEGSMATTWSSEPTVLTVVKKLGRLALPSGPLVIQYPLGREPNGTPTAATSGKFIGIRCTSTVIVTNCDGHIEVEE